MADATPPSQSAPSGVATAVLPVESPALEQLREAQSIAAVAAEREATAVAAVTLAEAALAQAKTTKAAVTSVREAADAEVARCEVVVSRSSADDAAEALPCLELAGLPANVLQCVAEAMVVREYGAFAQSCIACRDAAVGALHAVVPNEVARRLDDGDVVDNVLCRKWPALVLPDGVTSVGERAFLGCNSLASIVLPSSCTSVDVSAFRDCTALASVVLPSSCASIGERAFADCLCLSSIVLPEGVESIGKDAFLNCTALVAITLPASLAELARGAFSDCTSLTSIAIPDGVVIEAFTFGHCDTLASVTLPADLTTIKANTFFSCSCLTSISLPDSVTKINRYAFLSCTALDAPSRERIRAICPDALFE